jgi:hypothetical protein
MDTRELVQRFIKAKRNTEHLKLFVCKIGWRDSHTPTSTWELVATLPADASSTDIKAKLKTILTDRKYFSVCQECGERNPDGWMHGDKICQSCAERNHGIVY